MSPVILLTGTGAGSDITLPLDRKPTLVVLAERGAREDGEAIIIVIPEARPPEGGWRCMS